MTPNSAVELVSIHGGHSGQFCSHALDSLEAIVKEYICKGFVWIGITEHIPPTNDRFLYPDEKAAGLTPEIMRQRFNNYVKTCRELQKKYEGQIQIYTAFETEGYPEALSYAEELRLRYRPDYIVGSLHHINDISFDSGIDEYSKALQSVGGYEALYSTYFDRQYELLCRLRPEVVGHFDLIRIFDSNYNDHLLLPEVWQRICRNLEFIRKNDLILDFNLRALSKGAKEPYVAVPILKQALSLGIALVPGDDSHGVASVGENIEKGITQLISAGANTQWIRPDKRKLSVSKG
ncbi:MAG: histidinol-phosphatase [Desulfobacteraceae bacterium]|jgi:histidinol-phosphatase (PHP family)